MVDQFEWVAGRWDPAALGDSAGFLALGASLRAHTVVTAAVDGVLRDHGVSRTGYLVLVTLFLAEDGTRSHGRLARDLFVHPTTITLVTDQLVKDGLLRRAPDPADRRATLSTITAEGRRLAGKATRNLASAGYGFGTGDGDLGSVVDALRAFGVKRPEPVPRRARTHRLKAAKGRAP